MSELKAAVCPSLFLFFFFLLRCAVSLVLEKCVSESACGDERKGPPSSFPPRDSPQKVCFMAVK